MAFLKCIKNSKVIPNGKTVLPVSDVQIWLHCADIWDKTYTNLSQVLNDQTTYLKLVTTSNADDYMARSNWSATMCADEDAMEVIGSYDACVDALFQDDTWASAIGKSTYKDKVLPISTPTMTSASEPSGWVFASTVSASGYEGYKAFDKNTSTWWESVRGYPQRIFYRFPSKNKCYMAQVKGVQYPATGKFQASNDGSNWDDISNVVYLPTGTKKYVYANQKYKYYSFYTSSASSWTQVSELDFFCRDGGVQTWLEEGNITDKSYTTLAEVLADSTTFLALLASTDAVDYLVNCPSWASTICANQFAMSAIGANDYCSNTLLSDADWLKAIVDSQYSSLVLNAKVPKMTSDTTPSGQVLYSAQGSSDKGYMVFDESNSTKWTTSAPPQYIGYDFGWTVSIHKLYLRARANTPTYMPTEFKLQGSSNNSTWNDVESYTNSVSSGDVYFMNANDDAYRYWRLYITSSSASGGTALSRLQFYGRGNGGVQTWLKSAGISKPYTTLAEVFADSSTFLELLSNHDACDYLVTAIAFIPTFVASQYAMNAIGAYDYCANALMTNTDWINAIEKSSYADSVINASVPTMTSNTAPKGECFGTNLDGSYYYYRAFDKNTSTQFRTTATANVGSVGYKFVTTNHICKFTGRIKSNVSASNAMTCLVKGSNDGSTWTTLFTKSFTITNAGYYNFNEVIVSNTPYKYFSFERTKGTDRFLVYECDFIGRETGGVQDWLCAGGIADKTYITLTEVLADTTTLSALIASQDACAYLVTAKGFIEQDICDNENFMTALGNSNYASNLLLSDADWYEAIKTSDYASLVINVTVPKMTGDTTPSGEAYASSYASSYQPWKAFNQSTSYTTCWSWSGTGAVANNAWLAYDFGRAVKINGVYWQNRTTTQATRPLGTLIVQGSNDKTTWTDVSGTLTGSATASAKFNYHFANDNAYRHYRVLVTSTAVSGDTNLIIQQLQFYGREDV